MNTSHALCACPVSLRPVSLPVVIVSVTLALASGSVEGMYTHQCGGYNLLPPCRHKCPCCNTALGAGDLIKDVGFDALMSECIF